MSVKDAVLAVTGNFVAAIVMLFLAVAGFFITVFVVSMGSAWAGYTPSGDFVVLSASLLVAAATLAGASSLTGGVSEN